MYIICLIIYLTFPGYINAVQNTRVSNKAAPVFVADSVGPDGKGGSCFHCDKFVSEAFTPGFKLKSLLKNKNNFFKISKQPVVNMHDSAVTDTAFLFSNKKNEISIYKASHAEMINRIDISDKRFYLNGSINVGMTLDNFKAKFGIKSVDSDTIVISDEDNIVGFSFYFKKNILIRITYKALID
jgi:hypothetical protein